ncbi:hypothetical protein [Cronobacter sakazakii]|uniref:hypothetical protein n=1 Tax=Cronobacter sakazakii TaxID=28141 RepID=UPI002895B69B|nr:hypothetical protein [Cronobacter sakazakii]MDT3541088.1 hypothetical protein [Cronobacter sakazakii]MDT3627278.1 hypothetical protein [Cronobacter sakazakii]
MNKTLTSIVYTHTSCLFEDVPEYYVTEINGEIIFINENDEDTIGGKVKYFFINIKNSVFKADYLLDLVSNTEPFIGEIYRPDGFSFKKKNRKSFHVRHAELEPIDTGSPRNFTRISWE